MQHKKIYIFVGPPYSGKETQTTPLSYELDLPVFSMGQLIRDARISDPKIELAFQEYSLKGLHVPIEIKFELLKNKMDQAERGFILDNFPGSEEDLRVFNQYVDENSLEIENVFYLNISEEEMIRRFEANPHRGRADDSKETLGIRSRIQGEDREVVLNFYKEKGKLVEINSELPIEMVGKMIKANL